MFLAIIVLTKNTFIQIKQCYFLFYKSTLEVSAIFFSLKKNVIVFFTILVYELSFLKKISDKNYLTNS